MAAQLAIVYRPDSREPTRDTRPRLTGATQVAAQLDDLRALRQEHLIVFDLDVRNRMIERRTVGIGTLSGVECHPREVMRGAILNSAAAIIVAHNHPSGDATPSRQDIELTTRLREAGELIGIPVLDHVIVAGDGHTSLAERNWR